jgi:hypothetical protein
MVGLIYQKILSHIYDYARVRELIGPSPVREEEFFLSTIQIKSTVQLKMRICTLVHIGSIISPSSLYTSNIY